jgi:hypothetical protein
VLNDELEGQELFLRYYSSVCLEKQEKITNTYQNSLSLGQNKEFVLKGSEGHIQKRSPGASWLYLALQ